MRVAALYDVHGNIAALDAVLAEVDDAGVDAIVVGGDLVWGPFPRESIARLRELGDRARFVRGNSEREVAGRYDLIDGALAPAIVASTRWCAELLDEDELAFLGCLPEQIVLDVDGLGATLFCHATPRSDEELVTRITPDDEVAPMLEGVDAGTVVCGHTHVQFDRTAGGKRLVNAGSVGMPLEDEPGAYWALLGPDVELRRTSYDVAAAAARIRSTDLPFEQFAEMLLEPPGAEASTRYFEDARHE